MSASSRVAFSAAPSLTTCDWRSWVTDSRASLTRESSDSPSGLSSPIGRASLRMAAVLGLAARGQVLLTALFLAQRAVRNAAGVFAAGAVDVFARPFSLFLVRRLIRRVGVADRLLVVARRLPADHRLARCLVVVLNLLVVALDPILTVLWHVLRLRWYRRKRDARSGDRIPRGLVRPARSPAGARRLLAHRRGRRGAGAGRPQRRWQVQAAQAEQPAARPRRRCSGRGGARHAGMGSDSAAPPGRFRAPGGRAPTTHDERGKRRSPPAARSVRARTDGGAPG